MKTEYRAAYYGTRNLGEFSDATGVLAWQHDRLQALRADRQHLAGLPLQLGWPGRCEVLIRSEF